ncbi:MAG: histidine--tRNA ligase [bacterium]
MIKSVRGVYDILPDKSSMWQQIEKIIKDIFFCFGYREIRTPIFEYTDLFSKSIGDQTDIVTKEMYTFADRNNNLLTLRPEGTASVVRAYIEHKLSREIWGNKLYYVGPMFRYERPQAGRARQFHQIGVESFGLENPEIDAEQIILLDTLLKAIFGEAHKGHFHVDINSLGCRECRPRYQGELKNYLATIAHELCSDCQTRYKKNPLRVLDCKNKLCKDRLGDFPSMESYLCHSCREHFNSLHTLLETSKVEYQVNRKLVRGLDYYTRTTFEVLSDLLGAQNAIAGGGRYDYLVENFGGPPTPACGFALGMERLIMALSDSFSSPCLPMLFYLVFLGDRARKEAFTLLSRLRIFSSKSGSKFSIEMDYGDRSFKSQMRMANKKGASFALILGDNEIEQGQILLKNMADGKQETILFNQLENAVLQKVIYKENGCGTD